MPTAFDVTERPVFQLGPVLNLTVYPTGIASGEAIGTAQANTVLSPVGVSSTGGVGTVSVTATVEPSGINAGSGAVGSPALSATVAPTGVAGSDGAGQPQLNIKAPVYGVGSSEAVGEATAFTSMNIAGFSAAGGGPGSPSAALVMNPDGVASTVAFGDADTLATVFIVPGPFDPTNDFGDAVVTKRGWIFRNPTIQLGWRFQKRYEGVSLLKENGVWVEVSHPDLERTLSAQKYLPGGHDHVVSDSLKADLIAAGYTVTDEVVTTEDYKS